MTDHNADMGSFRGGSGVIFSYFFTILFFYYFFTFLRPRDLSRKMRLDFLSIPASRIAPETFRVSRYGHFGESGGTMLN